MDSLSQTQMPLNYFNDPNNSVNQTAVSIQQPLNDLDLQDQDHYAEQVLKQFYQSQLKIHADMRFDQLQKDKKIFDFPVIAVYPPQPLVYFLPYTILVSWKQNLHLVRDRIKDKYKQQIHNKQIQLNMYVDNKQQLYISLHSSSQLIYYKIRRSIFTQPTQLHKYPDALDKDILVDRLYNFYKIAYKKFYFQEVTVFFFYWAYVKNFLNQQYISPSAIKMIAIWMFIDFGYGIDNALTSFEKYFWKDQKRCLQMARTNKRGQCIIDKQILKYQNYSIQQTKGLYIVSQKKYQMIRLIQPVLYPIGQRNQQRLNEFIYRPKQLQYYEKLSQKGYQKLTTRGMKITRYKLLFKLMKNFHKYLNYPSKLIFDMKRKQFIFVENSNQFLLEVQHPVFYYCLSKGLVDNGSSGRRIKGQLNELIRKMKQNTQAIENVIQLFKKK